MSSPSIIQPGDFGPLKLTFRRSLNDRLWDLIDKARDKFREPGFRRGAMIGLLALFISASMTAFFMLRPRAIPRYLDDDLDDVLDYTLLTDDFNKLPLDERMRLMKDLVARLKGMSAGDSALMAAFAAGLTGKALDQVRRNMEHLAVDMWDDYARRYRDVPKDDRGNYLDSALLEFTHMMEDVSGFKMNREDNDRLADAKKQAKRDMQRGPEPQAMRPDRAGGLMKFMQERGQAVSNPEQRGRMAKFSRDMVRHLRGQDIDTGKPKDPDGGG